MQFRVIGGELRVAPRLHEPPDDAVDVARRPVGQLHRDRRALPDDLGEVERLLLRLHLQEELKESGDPLLSADAAQEQLVGAEGRGDGNELFGLGEGHGEFPSNHIFSYRAIILRSKPSREKASSSSASSLLSITNRSTGPRTISSSSVVHVGRYTRNTRGS